MHELRKSDADCNAHRNADADIVEYGGAEHCAEPDADGYSCRYGHDCKMALIDGETWAAFLSSGTEAIELSGQAGKGRMSWPKFPFVMRILPAAAC